MALAAMVRKALVGLHCPLLGGQAWLHLDSSFRKLFRDGCRRLFEHHLLSDDRLNDPWSRLSSGVDGFQRVEVGTSDGGKKPSSAFDWGLERPGIGSA